MSMSRTGLSLPMLKSFLLSESRALQSAMFRSEPHGWGGGGGGGEECIG